MTVACIINKLCLKIYNPSWHFTWSSVYNKSCSTWQSNRYPRSSQDCKLESFQTFDALSFKIYPVYFNLYHNAVRLICIYHYIHASTAWNYFIRISLVRLLMSTKLWCTITKLRRNAIENRAIAGFSGQKSVTRIILSILQSL